MYDIFVGFFTVYIAVAVSIGVLLLGYSIYLVSKEQQEKNEKDWSEWHEIGECSICGRKNRLSNDPKVEDWVNAWEDRYADD